MHGAIHGLLGYLICGQWNLWYLPGFILIFHVLIDFVPKESWRLFVLDQVLHVLALCLLVVLLPFSEEVSLSLSRIWFMRILVILAGISGITLGTGILIGKIMAEHTRNNRLELAGLTNGGLWIGCLERMLILVFILFDMPSGIGFLITAKSILRFGGVKDEQKMAEYVLIGTLMSFGLAITGSLLIQFVLKMFQPGV